MACTSSRLSDLVFGCVYNLLALHIKPGNVGLYLYGKVLGRKLKEKDRAIHTSAQGSTNIAGGRLYWYPSQILSTSSL